MIFFFIFWLGSLHKNVTIQKEVKYLKSRNNEQACKQLIITFSPDFTCLDYTVLYRDSLDSAVSISAVYKQH